MLELDTKIQYLKGVGPKMAARLEKIGIKAVGDLIFYFPRDYRDFGKISKIAGIQIADGEDKTIKARIIRVANRKTNRQRFTLTEAIISDDTGSLKAIWFNQPYLEKILKIGREMIFSGKVRRSRYSGELQMESPLRSETAKIVPIYSEKDGIPSYYIAKLQKAAFPVIKAVRDHLPSEILSEHQLMTLPEALRQLHEPESWEKLNQAKERMAFDEIFLFYLQKQLLKREILSHKAPKIKTNKRLLKDFAESLPFKLTDGQKKAAWAIITDLSCQKPMNRLLCGDVGSGKTVVAAMAALLVVKSGYRVALMSPTEILALQHYRTLKQFLSPFSISVGLISGSKKEAISAEVVVGTHALISGKNPQKNLGLVIIDEQHRFGVEQRNKLLTENRNLRPHFLSMTATPIPRTMSLVIFADLDISIIDQMPANRKKVITKFVAMNKRQAAYDFIRDEIKRGRQAFVICPLIDEQLTESDQLAIFENEKKTVLEEYRRLSQIVFPEARIAMLHGKLKPKEKERVTEDFRAGKYDILVSTSVVEVGVDIPGATVMMIENADRFGLAQLHQFRGRVGRSDLQSYCFLFSSSRSEAVYQRLRLLERLYSGFELAEKDLQLRGPGILYGYKQSGFWNFQFASLDDKMILKKAAESAKKIVGKIENYPLLLKKIDKSLQHLE